MISKTSRSEVWDERGRRIEAARQKAEESRPTCCPACGGTDITPTFAAIGVDEWECHATTCFAVWEVER